MDSIQKEELSKLASQVAEPCISIYLRTHPSGKEVNERYDLLVFKNLLQEAMIQLVNWGLNKREAEMLLKPAFGLLQLGDFWLQLSKGLAVLINKDIFKVQKLPFIVQEELHINSAFYLAPLAPLFTEQQYFYLLVLSKNASSFYKGNAFGMERIEVNGLPDGVDDVVHFEEKTERKLFRMGGTAPGAEASYHGHGNGLAQDKEYIAQYLTEVDQTLQKEVLANEKAPLVLAAVEYIVGIYKQVSHYKNITEASLLGNMEHTDPYTLFLKAIEIVNPYFEERCQKALKNYYNQIATPLTSSMPEKVVTASAYKQVSDLFVAKNKHIWGHFNSEDNVITIHEKRENQDECLINKAIVNTLLNGGDVYTLDQEKMPKEAVIAATFRF